MKEVYVKNYKLRRKSLRKPSFLELVKVQDHRARVLALAQEVEGVLGDGHEIIGIDHEAFEHCQSKITEVGIGYITKSRLKVEHIVISDYHNLRNGDRVPDNKENFVYGDSTFMTLKETKDYVQAQFSGARYIYGHALKGDLSKLGVKATGQVRFDTSTLHMKLAVAREGVYTHKKSRLSRLCDIHTPEFSDTPYHNAGNDIYVTGAVLKKIGDVAYVRELFRELDDVEIIRRTRNDEQERVLEVIPGINNDLIGLMNYLNISAHELLEDRQAVESILLLHKNVFRRMYKHGDELYWGRHIELGLVGEFFALANSVKEYYK
ncbi:hypothetical protein KG088_17165 [Halomonas sp. TRM85114]|uniref:hypothetical protein n=1 Tax=Halomonas jincaotanensis TaxID=2810616 RepID=UPI001BD5D61E|nr:hypothetical protein [Halomonas jincaotanensis]MBS9405345.1 hypothetical protein [Halomonas jincaotanensis]